MIRVAEPADAVALAGVHVTSWQHAYRGILPDVFLEGLDKERRTVWFQREIGAGTELLVSESEGEVVGFCWVGPSRDEDAPEWGEVMAIYVHPDQWGRGHGHRLLRHGEQDLADKGYSRALLWVLEANLRGRDFYVRQGWARGAASKMEDIGGNLVREVRYQRALVAV
jgi:GNAT superfamily N-acetyltransferase